MRPRVGCRMRWHTRPTEGWCHVLPVDSARFSEDMGLALRCLSPILEFSAPKSHPLCLRFSPCKLPPLHNSCRHRRVERRRRGEALPWRTIDGSCIAGASSIGSQVDHVAISPDGRGGVGTTLVWSDRQDDVRLSLEGSYRVCSQRLQMRQKVVEHVPIFI